MIIRISSVMNTDKFILEERLSITIFWPARTGLTQLTWILQVPIALSDLDGISVEFQHPICVISIFARAMFVTLELTGLTQS